MLKINVKNFLGKINKNKQLINLSSNHKISSLDRGWIQQELNMIHRKKCNQNGNIKKNIRNPPGKELAHDRGRERKKGYGYEHSQFKYIEDHRRQHKFDNMGKINKERCYDFIMLSTY